MVQRCTCVSPRGVAGLCNEIALCNETPRFATKLLGLQRNSSVCNETPRFATKLLGLQRKACGGFPLVLAASPADRSARSCSAACGQTLVVVVTMKLSSA